MSNQTQARFITSLTRRRKPRILYHYTSASGFVGILTSRAIWATNIRFLNDSSEYDFALDLARSVVQDRLERAHGKFDIALNSVFQERLLKDPTAEVYVSSFTENGDQLSQWRAYSAPAGGFAVGFTSRLLARSTDSNRHWFLAPCVYDSQNQWEIIRSVFQIAAESAEENRRAGIDHDRVFRESFKLIGRLIPLVAPVLKDPSFAEEQEWRLIHLPESFEYAAPLFRQGRSMLIPYHEHALAEQAVRLPIEEVIVGPTPHVVLAQNAAQMMLETHGLISTKVESSLIPYRTW